MWDAKTSARTAKEVTMTKLKHTNGGVSASVDGVGYNADEHGHIEVDNPTHVTALKQPPHSWVDVDEAELTHSSETDDEPAKETGEPEGNEDDTEGDAGETGAEGEGAKDEGGGEDE